MFQLAISYLILAVVVLSFSFLKQTCRKTYPVVVERMLISFEPTIIGLRTVQRIIKTKSMNIDLPCSRSDGRIRVRREADEVM